MKKKISTELSAKQKSMIARRELIRTYHFIYRRTIPETLEILQKNGFRIRNIRTIERDIKLIREDFIKDIRTDTADNLVVRSVSTQVKVIQEAWIQYRRSETIREKIRCLRLIHESELRNIDVFERLGLIEKVADRLDVDGVDFFGVVRESYADREKEIAALRKSSK